MFNTPFSYRYGNYRPGIFQTMSESFAYQPSRKFLYETGKKIVKTAQKTIQTVSSNDTIKETVKMAAQIVK